MGFIRVLPAIVSGVLLAGCNASSGGGDVDVPLATDIAGSSFADVNADGTFNIILNESRGSKLYDKTNGNGVSFMVGANNNGGVRALSGLIDGTNVATPPTAGSATMSGAYALMRATRIERENGLTTWTSVGDIDSLDLIVDFAKGTVKNDGGNLGVDGTFSGKGLTGTVLYRGVTGDLTGLVGENQTVGAFHGTSDNESQVYGGGFIADR
ncbi:hypothetical protein [Planktotalea sp.]|uniref:hypothetical protein n=1 Tax=Planktotalea sp. TaxID=2029877 RepID=UPI0032971903